MPDNPQTPPQSIYNGAPAPGAMQDQNTKPGWQRALMAASGQGPYAIMTALLGKALGAGGGMGSHTPTSPTSGTPPKSITAGVTPATAADSDKMAAKPITTPPATDAGMPALDASSKLADVVGGGAGAATAGADEQQYMNHQMGADE